MRLSDFDYILPPQLIAQTPTERRDCSRMMVLFRDRQQWEHALFADLPSYLNRGDLLVLNNTKVIPARLFARKRTGGRVELLLLEEVASDEWRALIKGRGLRKLGIEFQLEEGGTAMVVGCEADGIVTLRLTLPKPVLTYLQAHGLPPLPPYIKRGVDEVALSHDRERYQTIYARAPGSVAAPTAGLHFTEDVFRRLTERGIERTEITLHVGIGTFRPITAERVEDHVMHDERYEVPARAAEAINMAKGRGGRIVAVGTTTVRTLETVMARHGKMVSDSGRTDLFIYPPYHFRAVDALLTNFHLPRSTLLVLVSAFAGREFVLAAYEEAVRRQYRFFSYGDCMLIL